MEQWYISRLHPNVTGMPALWMKTDSLKNMSAKQEKNGRCVSAVIITKNVNVNTKKEKGGRPMNVFLTTSIMVAADNCWPYQASYELAAAVIVLIMAALYLIKAIKNRGSLCPFADTGKHKDQDK